MEKAINAAVKLLAEKIDASTRSEDALRYSQAALNLAHVLSVQTNTGLVKQ